MIVFIKEITFFVIYSILFSFVKTIEIWQILFIDEIEIISLSISQITLPEWFGFVELFEIMSNEN